MENIDERKCYFGMLPSELNLMIGNMLIYTEYIYILSDLANIDENVWFRNLCTNMYNYFKKFPVDIILRGRKIRWIDVYESLFTFDKYWGNRCKPKGPYVLIEICDHGLENGLENAKIFILLLLYEHIHNLYPVNDSRVGWIYHLSRILSHEQNAIKFSVPKILCSDIIDEIIAERIEYLIKLKSILKPLVQREYPYQYCPSFSYVPTNLDLYIDTENIVLSFGKNWLNIEGIYDGIGFIEEIGSEMKKSLINKGYV